MIKGAGYCIDLGDLTAADLRRGSMLIHGAIIAREYRLPCVTGVPEAVTLIATGDRLTVDGFLGLVTISRGARSDGAP